MKLFILCIFLPSVVFAQTPRGEAFYRQALKKFDSVRVLSPDSIFVPSVADLDGSPAAMEYLLSETRAAMLWGIAHHRDAEELKRWVGQVFGITLDSLGRLEGQYGDDYLGWLYARHLYAAGVQELYLVNRLDHYAKDEWLAHARRLFSDLELYFPRSSHMSAARATMEGLESRVAKGKINEHIIFREHVHSLGELIAPYKGKVVYLDIWGTWCGPCLKEMQYVAALKQHVDTSQVVFVYLDEDADENDLKWRDYARLYALTGEHLRLNSAEVEVLWGALSPSRAAKPSFPSYFIFGRDGKLVETLAKRPSEEEALYGQLKEAIGGR